MVILLCYSNKTRPLGIHPKLSLKLLCFYLLYFFFTWSLNSTTALSDLSMLAIGNF